MNQYVLTNSLYLFAELRASIVISTYYSPSHSPIFGMNKINFFLDYKWIIHSLKPLHNPLKNVIKQETCLTIQIPLLLIPPKLLNPYKGQGLICKLNFTNYLPIYILHFVHIHLCIVTNPCSLVKDIYSKIKQAGNSCQVSCTKRYYADPLSSHKMSSPAYPYTSDPQVLT